LDILFKIKRLVIARRVVFSAKAREERLADDLSVEDVLESILNAPTINLCDPQALSGKKSREIICDSQFHLGPIP